MLFSKLESSACIFIDRCIVLWTNQVLPLLVQRDSLNTSRSKDRTVSLFFLPKPLHSPHPLGSNIALPSSRSLLKTKIANRRSNGKIGDCEQSNTKQIPGLLLFIDFENAFDSIEWAFIEKTLNYYNFGSSLVAWLRLFYSDISSCVQNNE